MDLDYDGQVIYRNVFCYVPQMGNFGFGASTGGIADNHWIDDLDITTTTVSGPFVRAARPDYANARPDPLLQVILDETQAPTMVDPTTVRMTLNGVNIAAPQITQDVGLTYVAYEQTALLGPGSVNTVEVTYADNGVPPQTRSVKYDFVVTQYPTLPASFAAAAGVVDLNSSGFKVRVNQVLPDQLNTIDRAERQIAGTLKDALGQALPNIADLSLAVGDVFDLNDIINWDQTPFGAIGFFPNDSPFLGSPEPREPMTTSPLKRSLTSNWSLGLTPSECSLTTDIRSRPAPIRGTLSPSSWGQSIRAEGQRCFHLPSRKTAFTRFDCSIMRVRGRLAWNGSSSTGPATAS